MSVLDLVIAWTAVSVLTGPLLGTLLYRRGGELAPGWDPIGTLDDAAITPIEALIAPRPRHTTP